jgi:peptidoglycan/xylan/chitin deacetylase (PgdA/CDA1 family)
MKPFFISLIFMLAITEGRAEAFEQKANQIPVLLYHDVLPEKDYTPQKRPFSVVSIRAFEAQMDWLLKEGYTTLTSTELEGFIKGERTFPEKSVMIQFDDGLLSQYQFAYPIMKHRQLQGVVFLISSRIGKGKGTYVADYHPEYMNESEIKDVQDVWEIGSHTHNLHHSFPTKSRKTIVDVSWTERKQDLAVSRLVLDYPKTISYPFGLYHVSAIISVKQAGFKLGFTLEKGYVQVGDNPLRLKRLPVTASMTLKEFQQMVKGIPSPNAQ